MPFRHLIPTVIQQQIGGKKTFLQTESLTISTNVAWALDSAWSMEIDGFGFVQPIPYVDATHNSNRFKVVR